MTSLARALQTPAPDRELKLPPPIVSVAYLVAYVVLDWASFLHALSDLGITPWNPPPGLSLALLAAYGLGAAPLLFGGALIAELAVRGFSAPLPAGVAAALAPAVVYSACWWVLARLRVDLVLLRLRDFGWLLAGTALAASAVASLVYAAYFAAGLLDGRQAPIAIARYAIGDFLGIILMTPLLLRVPALRRRASLSFEGAALAVGTLALLWLVFGFDPDRTFKHFYVLMLPLAWAAVRFGIDGATVACLLVQIGVIAASLIIGMSAEAVVELQAIMLALAVTALLIGAAVDEFRRSEERRRAVHDQVSHLARLAVGGEIGSALAHELNQPLVSVANYVRVARLMLDQRPPDLAQAREAVLKADAQAMQAGDILRRLRSFLRRGDVRLAPVDLRAIVADATELAAAKARARGVELEIEAAREPLAVEADRVQAVQVALNLLVNAVDSAAGTRQAWVRAKIEREGDEGVLSVGDSGPGVPPPHRGRLFEPFFTTKPDGMGLGLSVSQTLAEAQGGRLWYEAATDGRPHAFRLALPLSSADA